MKRGGTTEERLSADAPEVAERVNEGMHLVMKAAFKIRRSLPEHLEIEELQAMGREGLLDAARTYDAERGVPFGAWAYLRIRGSIFDGLRRYTDLPRRVYQKLRALEAANRAREGQIEDEAAAASETPEAADARVASTAAAIAMGMASAFLATRRQIDNTEDPSATSPEESAIRASLIDRVRASIDHLAENERDLLTRVYFEDQQLDETAKALGMSKSWASRVHVRALENLANDLRRRKINDD
ncbi:MAG: sigma-70 family RNA polymerase sigma factor [Polyangiaceae bacterium]